MSLMFKKVYVKILFGNYSTCLSYEYTHTNDSTNGYNIANFRLVNE